MIVSDTDRDAIAAAAAELRLDVEDVVEDARGGTWSVRVVVDRDDGVDLDTLAALSSRLDPLAEQWGGPSRAVTFEVTSRGVDAPLTEARHWRRARGRSVDLRYRTGRSGPERARVGDLDADAGVVRLVYRRGRGLVSESVALDAVEHAVVRVEFRPAPDDEIALLAADPRSARTPAGGTHEGE